MFLEEKPQELLSDEVNSLLSRSIIYPSVDFFDISKSICAFSAQMQLSNAMCTFHTFEMNLFQIGTSWILVIVLCSLNEIVTNLLSCNH